MVYHVFKKEIVSKGGKKRSRWYYWYIDPLDKKRVQRVCKSCETKYQALDFVAKLPKDISSIKIKDVAERMFIPGGRHLTRLEQTGKVFSENTLIENRRYTNLIISAFGERKIETLKSFEVVNFLINQKKSASWKNHFLAVLNEVYEEAAAKGVVVPKLGFPTFHSVAKKADIFTDEELDRFLKPENFATENLFVFFLLAVSAGLRLSEARAFQPCQMLGGGLVLVNGFLDKRTNERNCYNKKGSADNPKWRVALVPSSTEEVLMSYAAKNNSPHNDLLFKIDGRPFRVEYVSTNFKKALKKSGIKVDGRKLTPHSLRYTYVSKMSSLMPEEIVQKMAGHTTLKMTDYYIRPSLQNAITKLEPVAAVADGFFSRSEIPN